MLNVYSVLGCVIFMVAVFGYGYKQGRDSMIDKITAQKLEYTGKLIQTERDYQTKQNEIISDYLKQIHELGEMYENEKIKAKNLRDTVIVKQSDKCVSNSSTNSRMSSKTTNQSDLRCYTESELLRKIEKSLDITRECDKLSVQYNTLLEWCKQ